jgi:hypothetical protein
VLTFFSGGSRCDPGAGQAFTARDDLGDRH